MRIYDGLTLHGRVVTTVVRGVPVVRDGAVVVRPGHGRFVRPEATA
jgi:dihydroorotase-like cyclic amidohydrolase